MDAWLIWLIIAVVLLVVEMLTLTAALGMLAIAALISAGVAALGLPVPVQLLAFTATAAVGVLVVRPVIRRNMLRPQHERFGIEALIGKPAYVVSEVSGLDGSTFWVIPSEVTSALQDVSRAFTQALPKSSATRETSSEDLAAHAAADAAQASRAAANAVEGAAEADEYRSPSRSRR
jgi:membrane protein implicated in regulation of membrane protease activity